MRIGTKRSRWQIQDGRAVDRSKERVGVTWSGELS